MFQKEIEKRVMRVIKARLADAQKEYNVEKDVLVTKCDERIKELEVQLDIDKDNLLDKHVNSVLSKVI